jgi:hypothetical protein
MANTMIVKNITSIQYFTERFETIDAPFSYNVNYHPDAPQKDFESMPTFVGYFKNCLAHSLPFVITEDNHLITNHVWPLLDKVRNKPQKTHSLWSAWGNAVDINLPAVTKSFSEESTYVWLPIDEHSAENPWHIWIDVISKFRLLLKQYDRPLKDYVFVLSNESGYFNRVVKELLPEIKYYVMPKNSTWRFKELIVPSMMNHKDGILSPPATEWIHETFGIKHKNPTRKIFVSRDDAPARRLSNAGEVFMALNGWEQVTLSAMSVRDQIKTFAEASHVISPHGAGLLNIVFCQPGANIIEIAQKELLSKKPYPILSHIMKHQHTFLLAETVSLGSDKPAGVKRLKDYNNYKVNVSELLRAIGQ